MRAGALAGLRELRNRAAWLPARIASEGAGNELIGRLVSAGVPAAIGKMGSVELAATRRHLAAGGADWGPVGEQLHVNAGVFPPDPALYDRFARRYLEALGALDVLGAWFRPGEARVARRYAPHACPVRLRGLDPFYHRDPWTRHLRGKRVLVVTPFAASVEAQYARREQLWPQSPDVLPAFELATLKTPFSAAIDPPRHADWFEALDELEARMEEARFDVALIGAGAWSLPLAAQAKRLGRCGVHLGGGTQVLFGIKGSRWDVHPVISGFYNEAWRRPADAERPAGFRAVERGCYW